jgi:hypothetical protein
LKRLLGGIKVFRQLDEASERAMHREIAHIATRCAVDCGRVIVSESVANKSLFKVINGMLDLADELNEEFLAQKVVMQAETVKLDHSTTVQTTATETVKATVPALEEEQNEEEELQRINVPPTKVV